MSLSLLLLLLAAVPGGGRGDTPVAGPTWEVGAGVLLDRSVGDRRLYTYAPEVTAFAAHRIGRDGLPGMAGLFVDFRAAEAGTPPGAAVRYAEAGGRVAAFPRPWLGLAIDAALTFRHISIDGEVASTVRGVSEAIAVEARFVNRGRWRAGAVVRLRGEQYPTEGFTFGDVGTGLQVLYCW